ncbi:TPA: TcpE family conjugal transfer membrane protein [Streptococcus suis]|uniref:TcpE family conjugal transfer membrane protein n=1 Tax=Streptococcus parasuis TaxID=1501662 RepID=UPI0023786D3C|nr:TcpE family conjugal transfer membrane protein [Streptococcus parasuis]WDN60278.1 conjugal transfer protein [Streptococcus parasuis]
MSDQLKDKQLYSYKQALSQPYWIQKINDDFSLQSPIKFSRIVYTVTIFSLLFFPSEKVLTFLPMGLRLTVSALIAWGLSETLANLIIDGKTFIVYLSDYFKYYFQYGMRYDTVYLNKGLLYKRPQNIINRKETNELSK